MSSEDDLDSYVNPHMKQWNTINSLSANSHLGMNLSDHTKWMMNNAVSAQNTALDWTSLSADNYADATEVVFRKAPSMNFDDVATPVYTGAFTYSSEDELEHLEKQKELEEEIRKKNIEINELKSSKAKKQEILDETEELRKLLREYNNRDFLHALKTRINTDAFEKLKDSKEFIEKFSGSEGDEPGSLHTAFIMSIDIRRSTELMLNAKTPQAFAGFISGLSTIFEDIIKSENGIFDKFTGDGILCYFPLFYSGDDAGYYAIKAGQRCHEEFEKYYHQNRSVFRTVTKETGLGIGIDYGEVGIVYLNSSITVIGSPVVYACRMGGGRAGSILLNQGAFDALKAVEYCNFEEDELVIKNGEGATLCYNAIPNGREYTPDKPDWAEFTTPKKVKKKKAGTKKKATAKKKTTKKS